ncbi:MAG: 16S rRNA (uracil(1498)-N(3))-methyltransferase [Elusimicrobiota bacterium]|jgi:16S rRNA (uracil1498-N3)-methyltransferase|nr:16S rRNA (uracil(1498)-N(3))-methyltransferase [Elusimicrobiota bacterium]
MPHFYAPPQDIKNSRFIISGEQARYIAAVRRFREGDEIALFDGLGKSYKAQILEISKGKDGFEIRGQILSSLYRKERIEINIWTAIPKGDRFEFLIEKSAEIGASKIVPLILSRSVIKEISDNKIERLRKISVSACSQCGRSEIMRIEKPLCFIEAAKEASLQTGALNILPWESEEKNSFIKILSENKTERINIFIGPEGGYENEEIESAKKLNFKTATLGDNILRIETAVLTSLILTVNLQSENRN